MVGTLNIVTVHLWNGKRTDNFQLDYSSPKLKCNSDKNFMMNYQVEIIRPFSILQVDRFPPMSLSSVFSISGDVLILAVSQSSLFYAMKVY